MLMKFFRTAALAVVFAGGFVATQASATTVVYDGDSVTIGPGGTDNQFIGDVVATGGAGSWSVDFMATIDPLVASASATVGPIVAGTFTGLVVSWVSLADGFVLATAAFSDPGVTLATVFETPLDLAQTLVLSWTGSLDGAGFDIEVSAVPLPAAGFLLIGALGGLGALRRRRKTA